MGDIASRMSALWGHESALSLYLQENGIETLLWAGVNTDQASDTLCMDVITKTDKTNIVCLGFRS
jgi:nicotinamidase-related amidase